MCIHSFAIGAGSACQKNGWATFIEGVPKYWRSLSFWTQWRIWRCQQKYKAHVIRFFTSFRRVVEDFVRKMTRDRQKITIKARICIFDTPSYGLHPLRLEPWTLNLELYWTLNLKPWTFPELRTAFSTPKHPFFSLFSPSLHLLTRNFRSIT